LKKAFKHSLSLQAHF